MGQSAANGLTAEAEDAVLRLCEVARENLSRLARKGVHARLPFTIVINDGECDLIHGCEIREKNPKPQRA